MWQYLNSHLSLTATSTVEMTPFAMNLGFTRHEWMIVSVVHISSAFFDLHQLQSVCRSIEHWFRLSFIVDCEPLLAAVAYILFCNASNPPKRLRPILLQYSLSWPHRSGSEVAAWVTITSRWVVFKTAVYCMFASSYKAKLHHHLAELCVMASSDPSHQQLRSLPLVSS